MNQWFWPRVKKGTTWFNMTQSPHWNWGPARGEEVAFLWVTWWCGGRVITHMKTWVSEKRTMTAQQTTHNFHCAQTESRWAQQQRDRKKANSAEYLQCTGLRPGCVTSITAFKLFCSPMRWNYTFLFYSWRNWGSERWKTWWSQVCTFSPKPASPTDPHIHTKWSAPFPLSPSMFMYVMSVLLASLLLIEVNNCNHPGRKPLVMSKANCQSIH